MPKIQPNVNVLYLDNHLLVVDKPAGQPVQGDRSGDLDLVREAKSFIGTKFDKPGNVFIGLVHRLDRPVSGVVVLARTSKAASRLSDQFRNRTVQKEYVALVEGRVTEPGELTSFIRKDSGVVKLVRPKVAGAMKAILRYEPLAVFGHRSVLRVMPETGRPHQIRIQLASEVFPIVGDMRYGASSEFDGRNIALHCHRMTLEHPVQKTQSTWSAALPRSWPQEVREVLKAD